MTNITANYKYITEIRQEITDIFNECFDSEESENIEFNVSDSRDNNSNRYAYVHVKNYGVDQCAFGQKLGYFIHAVKANYPSAFCSLLQERKGLVFVPQKQIPILINELCDDEQYMWDAYDEIEYATN